MTDSHLSDVATLRERARKNVENGAVTEGYDADREEILRLLNESLATELVCVLRYKRHYFMANGVKAHVAAEEFLEHATQEAEHADKLAGPYPAGVTGNPKRATAELGELGTKLVVDTTVAAIRKETQAPR